MNRLQVIKSGGATRLVYLDVLRATLAVLVVVHHVSLVYGAYTPFYYVEPPMSRGLLIFGLANQSWFMGCFFLLASYFTPGSFDRKGPVSFLKEKSLRLGVPLLIYIFVLDPIAKIGTYMMLSFSSSLN